MTPELTVIIVAYRSADDLRALLPLLADERLQVIVLDNASPDDVRGAVRDNPHVEYVNVGHNAGWTASSNAGAALAAAPVLVFLNPDVRVRPDQLCELASGLHAGVASVSPRFTELDGARQSFAFRFPRPLPGMLLFFDVGKRLDRLVGSPALRRRTYGFGREPVAAPDYIGAACMVVSRSTFVAVGEFDESMWLFFSDTDWALRAQRLGLASLSIDVGSVVHEGGGSVGHLPYRSLSTALQRDYLVYARKHYDRYGRLMTRLAVVILVGVLPALFALVRFDLAKAKVCADQARAVLR